MPPALPPPEPEPLVSREYRAEVTEQMGDEHTMFDPDNPDAWIHADNLIDFSEL